MGTAALRAHHWPVTSLLAAGCLLVGVTAGTVTVSVPLVDDPVPLWILLAMSAAVIVLPPLASAFPELERTLVREPSRRVARVLVAVTVATVILVPTGVQTPAGPPRHVFVVFAALLLALGIAAVVVAGELAWGLPLGVGLVLVVTEGGMAHPVTSLLSDIPVPVALLCCGVAMSLFSWRGPRRPS